MKPLEIIYWLRLALGIVAAFTCVGYGIATGRISHNLQTGDSSPDYIFFINSLNLTIIIYIISYYVVIKRKFMLKVEKPQKLFTTGIGIYFLAWIVFWILLYTIMLAS